TQVHKLNLSVAHQLYIDATSRIDVSGKGYLPGRTTGNTTVGGAKGRRGAGSYGGVGGAYGSDGSTGIVSATNPVYGDYADPDDWGSGGTNGLGTFNTSGGGLVKITAATLRLDGQLLADGVRTDDGGGGSGGGVYVAVSTLSGSGL